MSALFWFLAGYSVGSIPLGLLVSRAVGHIDIRRYGTGNIGASNVWRHLGLGPAAVVGTGTFLQGLAPAWIAGALTGSDLDRAAAAVGAVMGYGWSFLLRFRGGSAVGTATGALTALWPTCLAPLLTLYALGGLLRQPAPGVLLGLLAALTWIHLNAAAAVLLLGAAVVAALVVLKRLDGVTTDLQRERSLWVVLDRLVFDRRPGRRLVGPIGKAD